jgi:hypothetical protein
MLLRPPILEFELQFFVRPFFFWQSYVNFFRGSGFNLKQVDKSAYVVGLLPKYEDTANIRE